MLWLHISDITMAPVGPVNVARLLACRLHTAGSEAQISRVGRPISSFSSFLSLSHADVMTHRRGRVDATGRHRQISAMRPSVRWISESVRRVGSRPIF